MGRPQTEATKEKLRIAATGYRHTEESKKKMSIARKGKTFTEEHKRKLSEMLKGKPHPNGHKPKSIEHRLSISKALKGRIFSISHRNKISDVAKQRTGDRNPGWQGGKTSLVLRIRNSFEYRMWRSDIFNRDNYTCQCCGDSPSGKLNAHHILPIWYILAFYNIKSYEEALKNEWIMNLNNGITACTTCHSLLHASSRQDKKIKKIIEEKYATKV